MSTKWFTADTASSAKNTRRRPPPITRGTLDRYPVARLGSPGLAGGAVVTDALFACSQATMRDRLVAKVPTFGYEFDDPNAPDVEVRARFVELGAAHDSELPYLCQFDPGTQRPPAFNRRQRALAAEIARYRGRFARTGDPNGRKLPSWGRWTGASGRVQALRPNGSRTLAADAFGTEHQCGCWNPLLSAVAGSR